MFAPRTTFFILACTLAALGEKDARAEGRADKPPATDVESRLESRLDALEAENRRMRERVAELERAAKENEAARERLTKLEEDASYTDQQIQRILPLTGRLSGYLDFGFFHVSGNGAGVRPDTGYAHFHEYDGEVPDSWVFYGDPLSTMVNGRGEPADTGDSRAVTFDSIDNGGKSSFIVNALNMGLFAAVRDDLTMTASIDFVPRGRDVSVPGDRALGDFLDVKLAYVDYLVPIDRFELTLSAGKIDSVLGVEYRSRETPDRLTVTPSLLCRYTCGAPLGLRARAEILGRRRRRERGRDERQPRDREFSHLWRNRPQRLEDRRRAHLLARARRRGARGRRLGLHRRAGSPGRRGRAPRAPRRGSAPRLARHRPHGRDHVRLARGQERARRRAL